MSKSISDFFSRLFNNAAAQVLSVQPFVGHSAIGSAGNMMIASIGGVARASNVAGAISASYQSSVVVSISAEEESDVTEEGGADGQSSVVVSISVEDESDVAGEGGTDDQSFVLVGAVPTVDDESDIAGLGGTDDDTDMTRDDVIVVARQAAFIELDGDDIVPKDTVRTAGSHAEDEA